MICAKCQKDLKIVKVHIPGVVGRVCTNCRTNWRKANEPGFREKIQAYQRSWNRTNTPLRCKRDPQFKLKKRLRIRLHKALKRGQKTGSAVSDLGCSIPELKAHLESKFQPGMTWENWGYGSDKWNIDHVRPLASFNLLDREQLVQACHFSNLQPLWSEDNLKKSNTWATS